MSHERNSSTLDEITNDAQGGGEQQKGEVKDE